MQASVRGRAGLVVVAGQVPAPTSGSLTQSGPRTCPDRSYTPTLVMVAVIVMVTMVMVMVMVKMMGRETSEGARCACVSSGTGGSITTITFLRQGQQHCNNNTTTHHTYFLF